MTTTAEKTNTPRQREQRLAWYHPNGAGNGTAMQLELKLSRRESDRYNCFFMEMAQQKTSAGRDGERRVAATFDWERKLTVKLGFTDVCELLTVLEGRAEKVGGQRSGLYHENGKACTVIGFQKNTEKGGYLVSLSRKDKASGQVAKMFMALSEAEATGLRCVLQGSLVYLAFYDVLAGAGICGADMPRAVGVAAAAPTS
jgi:hypothetical protein